MNDYTTDSWVMISNKCILIRIAGLVMLSTAVWGQKTAQRPLKPIHCAPLEIPVRVENFTKEGTNVKADSIGLWQELNSAYAQLQGRWHLVQRQGGWTGPQRSQRAVELTVDKLGNAVISEKHKPLAVFRFQLRKNWQAYHSPIEGRKQSFFTGITHELIVEICADTLVLNEAIGDGLEYVFKR